MAGFTPGPAASASAAVRQGRKLIIPAPLPGQAALLPPVCVKCGAPADGKTLTKTFYWHHPAIYLAILAGLLIYVVLAVVLRKSIKVSVPLCARHAQRRSIAVTLAWVLPLIGFVDIFILSQLNVDGGVIALLTIALIVTGIVIWAVVANPIRPTMIDLSRGEFAGVCNAFLEHLPELGVQSQAVPQQRSFPPPPIQ